MNPERNGLVVGELLHPENFKPSSTQALEQDVYRIFSCDVWRCPVCGVEVLNGFGAPIYPHNENFKDMFKAIEALIF